MNYIAELNAFNDWCEQHYLSNEAQFLWYKLMAKNNKLAWCEWMIVDNLELMGILRTKREQTATDIRDKLIEVGLVTYIKGKKGSPNKYRMNTLSDLKVQTVVNSVVNPVVETVVNPVVETVDINKQNKTKQNEERINNNPLSTEPSAHKQAKSDIPALYAELCPNLPQIKVVTDKRKVAINKLTKQMNSEDIKNAFVIFNQSDFCLGINERGWKADFDFCIKPESITKALEGKYDARITTAPDVKVQPHNKETTNERNNRMLDEYFSGGEAYDRGRIEVIAEYDVDEL